MTSRRDQAALERLQAAARGARPDSIGRVAADLLTEANQASADAQALAEAGDEPGATAATSIAAAITRIHRALTAPDTKGDEQ